MALDATVGGSASNSYVSVADATAYFAVRQNASAWAGTDAAKEAALITATRRLDQERYAGEPVNAITGTSESTTQALQWPRYGACDRNGWDYLGTVIPQPVQDATCELALYLMNQGTTDPSQPTGLEAFEHVKIGSIDVTPRAGRAPDALPDNVLRILSSVLRSGGNTVRLVRG